MWLKSTNIYFSKQALLGICLKLQINIRNSTYSEACTCDLDFTEQSNQRFCIQVGAELTTARSSKKFF
jgi:hypothetical protein